jgi:hypothetical protein
MSNHDLRLADLSPHDTLVVRCQCGRILECLPGVLARLHRVSRAALIRDLRFRCEHCGRRSGFAISLRDERDRGDTSKGASERVIVAGPMESGTI